MQQDQDSSLNKLKRKDVEYLRPILEAGKQKSLKNGLNLLETSQEQALNSVRECKVYSNSIFIYYDYIMLSWNVEEAKPILGQILIQLSNIIKNGDDINLKQLEFLTLAIIQFKVESDYQKSFTCVKIQKHIKDIREKIQEI